VSSSRDLPFEFKVDLLGDGEVLLEHAICSTCARQLSILPGAVLPGVRMESGELPYVAPCCERCYLEWKLSILGFEPLIRENAEGEPTRGRTLFLGCAYRFERDPGPPREIGGRPVYALEPVDPDDGLPMRALAEFREYPSGASEVRWTSLGSPRLRQPDARLLFADFLERLSLGRSTDAHWDAFLIEHYPDVTLETIRSQCVGMLYRLGPQESPSQEHKAQLLEWAQVLRSSAA
jgi:hypothetical protein